MKVKIYFLLFLLISSCGPQRKVRYLDVSEDDDKKTGQSMMVTFSAATTGDPAVQSAASVGEGFLMYNNQKYYIAKTTPNSVKLYLSTLPSGSHQIVINGSFSTEQAYVNDVLTTINVVHINSIQ